VHRLALYYDSEGSSESPSLVVKLFEISDDGEKRDILSLDLKNGVNIVKCERGAL